MIRPTSAILLILAAAAGGALFHVSFEVSALDDRLATLNRDIKSDREAIHVLRAEWSFLNQPERIEELARRHLDLSPVSVTQLTGAGTLPVRPEREPEAPRIDNSANPDRAILLHAGAPRLKPAAPERPVVIPVAGASTDRVAANEASVTSRSLDDVLREIVRDDALVIQAGAQ
jgi:hypothetical protein